MVVKYTFRKGGMSNEAVQSQPVDAHVSSPGNTDRVDPRFDPGSLVL